MSLWSLIINFLYFVGSLFNPNRGPKVCDYGYLGDNCEIECGLVFNSANLKIVGGIEANPHSWPAQAFMLACYASDFYLPDIGRYVYQKNCYQCGGTLIDESTVLSAAHCLLDKVTFEYQGTTYTFPTYSNEYYPTNASMYTIYLGAHDVSMLSDDDISPAIKSSVSKVTGHEDYNAELFVNDIALLKLEKKVSLNNYIQPACLPKTQSTEYPEPDQIAWIVGWGTTSEGGDTSNVLKNANISIYDSANCSIYSDYGGYNDWSSQICAGAIEGGIDTCQGDSGGPLYVIDFIHSTVKYIVSGVVSYGKGCANPGIPGIYTRVSDFLDWINKNKN